MDGTSTNRDLYLAISAFGADPARQLYQDLESYLRSLLGCIRTHGAADGVTPDTFLTILAEAFVNEPIPYDPAWVRSVDSDPDELPGFAGCETRLMQQIVDLHEMQEAGILDGKWIELGVDAPRGGRWYNFSPCQYLECAAAGSIGGWEPGDPSGRILVPGMVAVLGPDGNIESVRPEDLQRPVYGIEWISWEQFADFLYFGKTYE